MSKLHGNQRPRGSLTRGGVCKEKTKRSNTTSVSKWVFFRRRLSAKHWAETTVKRPRWTPRDQEFQGSQWEVRCEQLSQRCETFLVSFYVDDSLLSTDDFALLHTNSLLVCRSRTSAPLLSSPTGQNQRPLQDTWKKQYMESNSVLFRHWSCTVVYLRVLQCSLPDSSFVLRLLRRTCGLMKFHH